MQDQSTGREFEALLAAVNERRALEARLSEAQSAVRVACQSASWAGASHTVIADAMGVSRQAVQQLLAKATAADRHEWEEKDGAAKESRRMMRTSLAAVEYGMRRGAFPCEGCGQFKSRPSDECAHCGSSLLTHNGDVHELNRAYGYAG